MKTFLWLLQTSLVVLLIHLRATEAQPTNEANIITDSNLNKNTNGGMGTNWEMDSDPMDMELCSSRVRIVYPQASLTKDSSLPLGNNNLRQAVRVEECINVGEPCHAVTLPANYTAKCVQKYNHHMLWVTTENKSLARESIKIPSSCQCVGKWNVETF